MNLAELAIRRKAISWMFVAILAIGGILSFTNLGRLEFPEFTLNQALVITTYPGASPQQVEEEVTAQLEDAIQQLPLLDYVSSTNSAGLSQITVSINDNVRSHQYAQIWDELRRKISDAQEDLPPGTRPSLVVDDFSDVFGVYVSITGEGYSAGDLNEYAKSLRRELVLVSGVSKVSIDGAQQEQVFVEISRERLSTLGISQSTIQSLLTDQNNVSDAGELTVDGQTLRIYPTGEFSSVSELENLIISQPGSDRLIYLGDIAEVSRGYEKTPNKLYHTNGQQAITLGVSFLPSQNVVKVGGAVQTRITELNSERPVGMDIHTIYDQADIVDKSISSFVVTLAQAIAIVFVVLLIFMGLRSGALMGLILLLSISGTFIVMSYMGINLQVISLGALVIALGMLVDNAIVVTEGMIISTRRGLSKIEAAKKIVTQTQWPLLCATVIAITAFAPIGLSASSSGEFAGSLFWVLLIALSISWITAMTLTPMFFNLFFREENQADNETTDDELYKGIIYTIYGRILNYCLSHRAISVVGVLAVLVAGFVAFGSVKSNFFPASTTPMFLVDYWMPEGTEIHTTEDAAFNVEQELLEFPEIAQITSVIGGGAQRFVLNYSPEESYTSYAQFIIAVNDPEQLDAIIAKTASWMEGNHPEASVRVYPMSSGPGSKAAIEAIFFGEDPVILRQLASQAADIIEQDPASTAIRTSWRNRVKVVRPQFIDDAARRAGITKANLDEATKMTFTGREVGTYRDGTNLLPIVLRAPQSERTNAETLRGIQVWSPEYSTYVPITQVVSSFDIVDEDPLILRRDRKRVIAVYAEPVLFTGETANSVLNRIRGDVEAIPLPEGYSMSWGGEYESSADASGALFGSIPLGLLAMFIITVLLFNNFREPIVIWLTVPLALIGVAFGLLVMGEPFGFMALLGLLSLVGMLLKNGIVLVEQIRIDAVDKELYTAIYDASVSRVRPVMMAALTTMLGMIPLVFDAFFASMAVTIIFGLGFATLITLIVLPVLYAIFYRVRGPEGVATS